MTASAVYEGWVAHRRHGPHSHTLRYRIFLTLFDLEELIGLLDRMPLWSARRPAPARMRRGDYLGDCSSPLADCARDLSLQRVGRRPAGPVRLLTAPRVFGAGFNPVSFHYLFEKDGDTVDSVIAEVSNTPWGESTEYVLDGRNRDEHGMITGEFDKTMHVSPFQPMGQRYEIAISEPGENLRVRIGNVEHGREVFTATMALERRELTRARMAGLLFRYPPAGIATVARIYANALKLRLKGAPVHRHPGLST